MNPASLVLQKIRLVIKKLGKVRSFKNPYKKLVHDDSDSETYEEHEHGAVHQFLKRHVLFYVGMKKELYWVPLEYLSCPALQELMLAYVFDAKIKGPIWLYSCTTDYFDRVLKIAEEHQRFVN